MSSVVVPRREAGVPRALVAAGGLVAGTLLIAFAGSNLVTSLAQRSLRGRWDRVLAGGSLAAAPRPGDPVAEISIPAIGLDVVAAEGPSSERRAPVHLAQTALPGRPGLSAVEAGRLGFGSFFAAVDRLGQDDEIDVRTPSGVVRYRVVEVKVLDLSSIDLSSNGDTSVLLLMAPASRLGGAGRIVIRASVPREESQ